MSLEYGIARLDGDVRRKLAIMVLQAVTASSLA